ncbi:hypothetical protein B0H16DRAFT_429521 [Mycena metata]|uniref:Uncharacterized protein n=1 Tax=Mycena metata TaxID=1033252 RepID=A0AAD7JIW7_9AGAR|nr:hypothetical protein B0H16DRAFT_429521 [Mycena metata]
MNNPLASSAKGKGTHGGARRGAGRPRKTAFPVAQIEKDNTLGNRMHTSTMSQGTSPSSIPIQAFFLPRNANRPVPSGGRGTIPVPMAGPAPFWSNVGTVRNETTGHNLGSRGSTTSAIDSTSNSHILFGEFTQLNEQLDYMDDHDEHADIASGDRLIDDSFVNDLTGIEETNAEPHAAEPAQSSALHNQLVALQTRLMQEEAEHGKPLCYTRGDFFDRPPHPIFALETCKDTTGLKPEPLYWRKVFVWLPHLLPGHPETFKCVCNMPLTKNGRNTNPIARRVRAMPADFFLYTNCFICDPRRVKAPGPGCGKSFQGTDPHILEQMPEFVLTAFPGFISARGAISNEMSREMSNMFAKRFGPAPFAKLVSEIQHRFHADIELMYLGAAKFWGQRGIKPCSPFDDPNGYAGAPPSIQYLKGMFTDKVKAHRVFIDRDTASKPMTFAKTDHTFDYLKGVAGVKGEDIFNAAYSAGNEFEEIRAHSITPTKSLAYVEGMLEDIQEGLKNCNNPPTQILYTDSPQAEWSFHESINQWKLTGDAGEKH